MSATLATVSKIFQVFVEEEVRLNCDMTGDGTLQQIDEALDYRVKEFKVNRMNPGLNIRFWTMKDVDRSKEFMFAIQKRLKKRRIFHNLESFDVDRSKEFMFAIQKRLKKRRIFRNLESFVGG
uniref:Uncharacterized protein n=1 Tax=Tanacetum cinerariifolium TaxID=118510 RepID=A0A699KGI9_TANCI|nr:hypothetical protein [Tanacetum cinerariifolium]